MTKKEFLQNCKSALYSYFHEDENENFILTVAVPGVSRDGIKVMVFEEQGKEKAAIGGIITKVNAKFPGLSEGDYFYISNKILLEHDLDKVSAEMSDGLLVITVPKKEEKTVEIKIN